MILYSWFKKKPKWINFLFFARFGIAYPELDPVLSILVLNDGSHLEVVAEGAGDVVGRLAGLDAALDTAAHPLLAQHAHQRPAGRLQHNNVYKTHKKLIPNR